MPELPEVEVTRRGLAPELAGRIISGVAVRNPRLRWPISAEVHRLAGSTVRAVLRRGKYLLVDCGACEGRGEVCESVPHAAIENVAASTAL